MSASSSKPSSTHTRRDRTAVLQHIQRSVLIPVIRAESTDVAVKVTEALVAGGIDTIEITMTVPDALAAIRAVTARFGPGVLVGAGTVIDAPTVSRAIESGAEFIVSPAMLPDVIAAARAADVAVLPGAMTPTEVITARRLGADVVKIFPASHVGGASYVKALKGPFPDIPFCPTGGVNLETIGEFLRAGAVAVGVGGELVLKSAIAAGDYGRITALAKQFVEALARARTH
jgi:2-dehydro-3-deoxyphosphogluconate aldolase/(4S)-4-hydroxy-2-oxoglutarate aldolase